MTTKNMDGPDFGDGCDSEGFPGGCERMGHAKETHDRRSAGGQVMDSVAVLRSMRLKESKYSGADEDAALEAAVASLQAQGGAVERCGANLHAARDPLYCAHPKGHEGPHGPRNYVENRAMLAGDAAPGAAAVGDAARALDVDEWAELYRLREDAKGPDGFGTWKDAAVTERVRRVEAERKLEAALATPSAPVGVEGFDDGGPYNGIDWRATLQAAAKRLRLGVEGPRIADELDALAEAMDAATPAVSVGDEPCESQHEWMFMCLRCQVMRPCYPLVPPSVRKWLEDTDSEYDTPTDAFVRGVLAAEEEYQ